MNARAWLRPSGRLWGHGPHPPTPSRPEPQRPAQDDAAREKAQEEQLAEHRRRLGFLERKAERNARRIDWLEGLVKRMEDIVRADAIARLDGPDDGP